MPIVKYKFGHSSPLIDCLYNMHIVVWDFNGFGVTVARVFFGNRTRNEYPTSLQQFSVFCSFPLFSPDVELLRGIRKNRGQTPVGGGGQCCCCTHGNYLCLMIFNRRLRMVQRNRGRRATDTGYLLSDHRPYDPSPISIKNTINVPTAGCMRPSSPNWSPHAGSGEIVQCSVACLSRLFPRMPCLNSVIIKITTIQ